VRRTILTITTILIISTSIGCNTTSDQNDLGIVEGKLDTFFSHDTAYAYEIITVKPKAHQNSLDFKPYNIGISYNKGVVNKLPETEPSWKLRFFIVHSDKYTSIYPTKGILRIDDFEIIYDVVNVSASKSDSSKTFFYSKSDIDYILNYLAIEEDMLNKLAKAKRVSLTILGVDKEEYILSPKIIEDASKTLEYFDIIKTTKPSFY